MISSICKSDLMWFWGALFCDCGTSYIVKERILVVTWGPSLTVLG